MLCCDLENMNYKSGSWNFLHLFFYHCLLKKLPFSIWFKLSWKVPGCPRFAPFHCKFWKIFRGGKTPRTPPLVASPRCARVSEQIYPFLVRIYPFWTKNLPPSNFGVGRSGPCWHRLCCNVHLRMWMLTVSISSWFARRLKGPWSLPWRPSCALTNYK